MHNAELRRWHALLWNRAYFLRVIPARHRMYASNFVADVLGKLFESILVGEYAVRIGLAAHFPPLRRKHSKGKFEKGVQMMIICVLRHCVSEFGEEGVMYAHLLHQQ